jgi:hypothetical protein
MPEMMVCPVSWLLFTLKVGSSSARAISALESLSRSAEVLGSTGHGDDRVGEVHGLQRDGVVLIADGVAGGDVLEADRRADVAAVDDIDLVALVGVHLEEASETVAPLGAGVVDGHVALRHAGVDAEEDELADVGVGHDLEREGGERLLVADFAGLDLLGVGIGALGLPDVDGGRQVVENAVEKELDALVLEGRPAKDRNDLAGDGGAADGLLDKRKVGLLVLEEERHDFVVVLGDGLDDLVVGLGGLLLELLGNLGVADLASVVAVEVEGLLAEDVDDAFETGLRADRNDHRKGRGLELGLHVGDDLVVVAAGAVHLVDERDDRDVVAHGLAPDGFGLGLDAARPRRRRPRRRRGRGGSVRLRR